MVVDGRLTETLDRISRNLREGRYPNESAVREAIVLPILGLLGWDTLDPSIVQREYQLADRRCDYALSTNGVQATVLIEVKRVGNASEADRQLFEYAFHEGTQLAVLTDGQEWSVYLPAGQGSYDERCVFRIDLRQRDAADAAERLTRYLQFGRVKDGQAVGAAQEDHRSHARAINVEKALPEAWRRLVSGPDELLVDMLLEEVQRVCGYPATREQVVRWLVTSAGRDAASTRAEQTAAVLSKPGQSSPSAPKARQPVAPRPDPEIAAAAESSLRTVELLGKRQSFKNAIDALIWTLTSRARRDSTFIERFAAVAPGRSRNHVSRNKTDIYPGRPDLEVYVRDLVPGWCIGTNIANREKLRLMEKACDVAGIKFGDQLRVLD